MPNDAQNGQPTQPGQGQTTEPAGLTPELVTKLVQEKNDALAASFRRSMEESKKAQADMAKQLATALEQLAGLAKPPETTADAGEDGKGGKKSEAQKQAEAAAARLTEETKKLREALDAEKKQRAADLEKAQRTEERSTLAQAIAAAGIEGAKQAALVEWLYGAQKKIVRTEAGEIGWSVMRGTPPNTYPEIVAVSDGLKEWLETKEGKEFAPPRGSAGAGAQPGRAPGHKLTKAEQMQELDRLLATAWAAHNGTGG